MKNFTITQPFQGLSHPPKPNYQKQNMNASANKGRHTSPGAQRQTEKKVETVDYSSPAGQGVEQIPPAASNTSGGILANAAASVTSTLESAKDVISRK